MGFSALTDSPMKSGVCMKKKIFRILSVLLAVSFVLIAAGCSQPEPAATTTVTSDPVQTATEEPLPATTEEVPVFRNPYTGLAMDESLVGKRPIAVMFNNLREALPQKGISACDVVYEVLAEGGILRMCGVILDYENVSDLGSMRSARPYYVELALANDAIFVHAGGTERAYEAIANFKVNDVDGTKNGPFRVDGKDVFWRDQDRLKAGLAYEHTLFTSGAAVTAAIGARQYRTTLNDENFTAFKFKTKATALGTGKSALEITVPHSNYSVSQFKYNAQTGLYEHSEYNAPHIDGNNNAQITADNVFILFAAHSLYPGQTVTAYQKIDLVGTGGGWYCYGGEAQQITWKRDSQTGSFQYFDASGAELAVNPGRSYIAIANQKIEQNITIS